MKYLELLRTDKGILAETDKISVSAEKKSIHILYVDGDKDILHSSKLLLEMKGLFKIDHALSVEEAFEKLKILSYDAVISDFELPKKNGLQFLKELKDLKNDIPFILFTSKGGEEVAVEALNLGADGYFNKLGNPTAAYRELAHGIILAVDRRRSRQALDESEKRYRSLMEHAVNIIIVHDLDGRILDTNKMARETLGYTKKEMLSMKISALDPRASIGNLEWSKALDGQNITFESNLICKNKSCFPVEVSLGSMVLNEEKVLIAIVRDITERKKAEENQRLSEQKYQSLFEYTPDAIVIFNFKGTIESANQAAAKLLGYNTTEELVGNPAALLSANAQELKFLVQRLAENGYVKDFEATLKKINGESLDISVTITVQKDGAGNILRYESIIRDITESKKAQSALRERTEQLEITQKKLEEYAAQMEKLAKERARQLKDSERLATIGATAGMVGHDLRNPLTGIKNAVYFLKIKGSCIAPDKAKEMLETIDNCVDYSNKIVSDLLDYSRQIHLELQLVSPRQLMADALSMVHMPETINVVNNLPEKPLIEVDPDKIKRVFTNLIKNAVDAMSNIGELTIDGNRENESFRITLTDTGPGISDDILPKLFLPLFTTKAQGMGFGLAICKRLVEAHGGAISVKTAIGEDTEFTVSLPLKNPYNFYQQDADNQGSFAYP